MATVFTSGIHMKRRSSTMQPYHQPHLNVAPGAVHYARTRPSWRAERKPAFDEQIARSRSAEVQNMVLDLLDELERRAHYLLEVGNVQVPQDPIDVFRLPQPRA